MSGLIDKRKRSREDDCDSSTPLSKRINNLHLNNFEESSSSSSQNDEHQNHYLVPKSLHHYQNSMFKEHYAEQYQHQCEQNHKHLQHPAAAAVSGVGVDQLHHYSPELDEAQNPFYYVKNKLLHELHLERLKRCTI